MILFDRDGDFQSGVPGRDSERRKEGGKIRYTYEKFEESEEEPRTAPVTGRARSIRLVRSVRSGTWLSRSRQGSNKRVVTDPKCMYIRVAMPKHHLCENQNLYMLSN